MGVGTDRRRRFVIRVRGFGGFSMIWKEEGLGQMRSQASGERFKQVRFLSGETCS
jgi:hypothetical protein